MWRCYLRKKYNGKEKDSRDKEKDTRDARDARLKKTDKELEDRGGPWWTVVDCGRLWLCTERPQISSDLESRATLLHLATTAFS